MKSLRLHGAQRDDRFVGAAVAHHAHRLDRQEHGEGLAGLARTSSGRRVHGMRSSSMKMASARRSRSAYSRRDLAQDAHAQARARERMAVHHLARQAQRDAQVAAPRP
jgi:hypothetical protein